MYGKDFVKIGKETFKGDRTGPAIYDRVKNLRRAIEKDPSHPHAYLYPKIKLEDRRKQMEMGTDYKP